MVKVTALVDDGDPKGDVEVVGGVELVPAPPVVSHPDIIPEEGPVNKEPDPPIRSVVDIFWAHGERESRRVSGLKVEHGIATFQQGPVTHYINLAQTRSFTSEEAQDA